VISGPTRSYEIVESHVGRAGLRLARQHGELGFNKLVAVKSLRSEHADIVHALVVDESRLRHANIVSTLDVIVEGGVVHVVMEYVEGPCLADLLELAEARRTRLPVTVAAAVVHDVLLGLDHAHGAHDASMGVAGMIHVDVSPRNVIVGFDGLTRIVDLGLPSTVGKDGRDEPRARQLAYVAPEQRAGARVDRTADMYACGVMLWQLLTGTRSAPASPAVTGFSEKLDRVLERATSPDPQMRFPTGGMMARALREAVPLASRVDVTDTILALPTGRPGAWPARLDAVAQPQESRRPRHRGESTFSSRLVVAAGMALVVALGAVAVHTQAKASAARAPTAAVRH
jgi:serine/threonine-protein kinase